MGFRPEGRPVEDGAETAEVEVEVEVEEEVEEEEGSFGKCGLPRIA
jgi:hypothetical protein